MALRSDSTYKENAVGGRNGPKKNPEGAVGMPNGPRRNPQGAVGMPNGPKNLGYREGAVGMPNGPRATQGAVGMPNGPRATQGAVGMPNGPRATQGAVGMPNGPRATEGAVGMPNGPRQDRYYNQQTLQDQENANLDNPNYREGRIGGHNGPTAIDPMYGPPAPAFPEIEDYEGQNDAIRNSTSMIPEIEDYEGQNDAIRNSTSMIPEEDDSTDYEQEARDYQQSPEANQSRIDAARQATQNDQQKINRLTNEAKNSNFIGRDALGGSFNNPDTQNKFNQAMRPQAPAAPAQAAQGGQEDLIKNWSKYHGKKNAYNEKSSADRAMLAAMQEAQRTGQSVSRVANGALSTEGRRAAGKLIPYSKNPNSIYAKGR